VIKVVYLYNLKPGVDRREFETYYFEQRIKQVLQVPTLKKFTFSIAEEISEEKPRFRYMAECFYEDLETAKETINSEYFKDVHGYIAPKLADLTVVFYQTHEWIP
jgi:uncharacterized protein (TIGR02118 family)